MFNNDLRPRKHRLATLHPCDRHTDRLRHAELGNRDIAHYVVVCDVPKTRDQDWEMWII